MNAEIKINGKAYPVINEEDLYSYDAARKMRPDAWKNIPVSGEGWSRDHWHDVAPKGLGVWGVCFPHWDDTGRHKWVYICPNGLARPVPQNYGDPTPPPLPRAGYQPLGKCSCGKVHYCTACGKPAWNELHGCADGFCTYCYNAG